MKNKKIIKMSLLLLLFTLVIGITYAAFTFTNTGDENAITTGKINFSYTEPSNSYVVENTLPTYDSSGKTSEKYFEFTVSSTATTNSDDDIGVRIPYEISIESLDVDSGKTELTDDQIKIYLTEVEDSKETKVLSPIRINQLSDSIYGGKMIITSIHEHKNGSKSLSTTYRLRAWIASDVDASNWDTVGQYQYKFRINVNSNTSYQKDTYTVKYLVDGAILYQEEVEKGEDVENIPEVPEIENVNGTWSNDGTNIQSDLIIIPEYTCTLTFTSDKLSGTDVATLSAESYEVPYKSVITIEYPYVKLDGEIIVTATELEGTPIAGWEYGKEDIGKETVNKTVEENITLNVNYGGCVLKGTKITMADYSLKNVEDIKPHDEILSYDFFTGEFVKSEVVTSLYDKSAADNVITLNLSNGNKLQIIGVEYIFDMNKREYILVSEKTYKDLIGKEIMVNNNGKMSSATIINTSIKMQEAEYYTLYVEKSRNYIANNTMTKLASYWVNDFYEINKDYVVDMKKFNEDIEKYGLFTYDEVKDYVDYEYFDKLGCKLAKIIVGKGLATEKEVLESFKIMQEEIKNSLKRFE